MFGTFCIRSITLIFLGLHVTAIDCDDDINLTRKDLVQCSVGLANATTFKTDSVRYSRGLIRVVDYMGVAKVSLSRALAMCLVSPKNSLDCEKDVKYVGQDFYIMIAKVNKGYMDCVILKNGTCSDDVSYILTALDDAITHSEDMLTDCDIAPGSACAYEFREYITELAETKEAFTEAQSACATPGEECIDEILQAAAMFFETASTGMESIHVCINSGSLRHDH